MTSLLLAGIVLTTSPTVMDQVHTVRIETSPGTTELCNALAISSTHAVSLCLFSPENTVAIETDEGLFYPDSLIFSPDLGIVILSFEDEIFDEYQVPSETIPEIGERLTIVGQGLSGFVTVDGRAMQQYPDGSFIVSAELREGLMGASVFNSTGDYIGLITGLISTSDFASDESTNYLVLYPSQIWYMWAKLVVLDKDMSGYSFGVLARSSISLSTSSSSGIQIVSVSMGSRAWDAGLRPGDLITHIDDTPVYHPQTLRGLLILSDDTLHARVVRSNFERNIDIPPFQED